MGATCCNYQPKDGENLKLAGKMKPKQQGIVKAAELDPEMKEQLANVLNQARRHETKVIKIQALVRGFLVRQVKNVKK